MSLDRLGQRLGAHPRAWLLVMVLLSCVTMGNFDPGPPIGGLDLECPKYDPSTSPLPAADLALDHTAEVGAVPGSFAVSQTGAATYTIPLVAPPGRAGMEPHLSISYNSGAGEGFLGVGFNLGGFSTITRCPSNLADDGVIRAVQYNDTDHLCLDGVRLVEIGYTATTREYRTKPDTFTKIVAHLTAGPQWFEVFAKSGHVVEYGHTESAQAMAPGGWVATWWISQERDRRGNAINYVYSQERDADGHTIEIVPERIEYAFDEKRIAQRWVSFEPDKAFEPTTFFTGGMKLHRTKVLSQVKMFTAGDVVVRSYRLGYKKGEGTRRALVSGIQECVADSVICKPETKFDWTSHASQGFRKTQTAAQWSNTGTEIVWLLADVNGDGLDDLVVSRESDSDSSTNEWWVALNTGGSYGQSTLWASFAYPSPHHGGGKWNPILLDYDHDGLMDIFLDAPDISWPEYPDTYRVLRAKPNHTFELIDTGIPRAPSLDYDKFDLSNGVLEHHKFLRLGDIDGDGKADLIQCVNPKYDSDDPSTRHWTVHFWTPSRPGIGGPGFDPTERTIPFVDGVVDCAWGRSKIFVADIEGTGSAEIIVPFAPGDHFGAVRYLGNDRWATRSTNLQTFPDRPFTRFHFLDGNGDGISDVITTGLGQGGCYDVNGGFLGSSCDTPEPNGEWSLDLPYLFVNTGSARPGDVAPYTSGRPFADIAPTLSGPLASFNYTDQFGDAATPIDFDGDGRTDLAMPIFGRCGNGTNDPCWVVLKSSSSGEGLMEPIDTQIPAVTDDNFGLTVPALFRPQVTDINGDGRHDLVFVNPKDNTRFDIYTADGPQDLLRTVTDGSSPIDPGDNGFIPTVDISYGNLVDHSITYDIQPSSSLYEELTYLGHFDPGNTCVFPRSCVAGPQRVVSGYALANGRNEKRNFAVRYRDARYHHLGRGFLGFGERQILDQDTRAGSVEQYENILYSSVLNAYPYAGQVKRSFSWANERSNAVDPGRVEISVSVHSFKYKETNGGLTYFTYPEFTMTTREEGVMKPATGARVIGFVRAALQNPLTIAGESNDWTWWVDDYGNATRGNSSVVGADAESNYYRIYDNDPDTWLIGKLRMDNTCSSALGQTKCRTTRIEPNGYGEIWRATAGDDQNTDTQLDVHFFYDKFGHVIRTVADDMTGHHRESCVSYDGENIFPYAMRNGVGHTTYVRHDPGLGVKTAAADPNGLVTLWRHDGFGRVTEEQRPDGSGVTVQLDRVKKGGPQQNWWATMVTTREVQGAIRTTELDSLGRPVHSLTVAGDVKACGQTNCTGALVLEQETKYDFLGRVERQSLPWMTGDTLSTGFLYHEYTYDAGGRVTSHIEPWGRTTTYAHDCNLDEATDWLGTTTTETDALGRTTMAVDKMGNAVYTSYGPFGGVAVTIGGGGIHVFERDAYGRVLHENDPDRGQTDMAYDGFGQVRTMDDPLQRHTEFEYDAIGRMVGRADKDSNGGDTTFWHHDTAKFGVGKLHYVENEASASVKEYAYNQLSQLERLSLSANGELLQATFGYDAVGRLRLMTYPQFDHVDPLVVLRDYDGYGNLVKVRDNAGGNPYWQLDEVDGAGRPASETFGNGVTTRHSFRPDSGMLLSVTATKGTSSLQELVYAYDLGLRMKSRTDLLQTNSSGVRSELFRHDAIDRLTCTGFRNVSLTPDRPLELTECGVEVRYRSDGNIDSKSDVGSYAYDPDHPHAVAKAGGLGFKYDAVGNQIDRDGLHIEYTAFDLPKSVGTDPNKPLVSFQYDGDQQRILKWSAISGPEQSTIYFEGLYEGVTVDGGPRTHRYFVPAGSATLVINRTAEPPDEQVAYFHTEALGSTDIVTDGKGKVTERRSFDAFGARRNPTWDPKQPAPAPYSSPMSTMGFTGHEADDDLGLINMKGRIYDPKVARFLQTDPIVSRPHFSQSWNPYSYVLNSPLNFVDPDGFEEAPPPGCDGACVHLQGGWFKIEVVTPKEGPPSAVLSRPFPEAKISAPAQGSAQNDTPGGSRSAAAARDEGCTWRDHSWARYAREFSRGTAGGLIPLGVDVDKLAAKTGVLPKGTAGEQVARALGQIAGGALQTVIGGLLIGQGSAFTVGSGGLAIAVGSVEVAAGATLAGAGLLSASGGLSSLMSALSGGSGQGGGKPPEADGKPPELKQVFEGVKNAPGYPANFVAKAGATTRNVVKDKALLEMLREHEAGEWAKVYKDGWIGGQRASLHYFQSRTGKIFNFKIKWVWSNGG
jgi:RHS repeat-associated protein